MDDKRFLTLDGPIKPPAGLKPEEFNPPVFVPAASPTDANLDDAAAEMLLYLASDQLKTIIPLNPGMTPEEHVRAAYVYAKLLLDIRKEY